MIHCFTKAIIFDRSAIKNYTTDGSSVIALRSSMTLKVKPVIGSPITDVIQSGSSHFAMVEKVALYNLDELMRRDTQAARLIVTLIRLMEPGSGGVVVISRSAMCELLGVSAPTVQRAIRTLVEGEWVQRIRIGGAYALAINKTVAWVGPRGQLAHAVFSATVVASRSEQDAWATEPRTLREIPITHPDESVLPVGMEPDPPSQPGLEGVEPPVATTGGSRLPLAPQQKGRRRLKVDR